MAGIYKRGQIWWIKYHLNGVRVQESLHTGDTRVARARKSQIEYRVATGGLTLPSETPIAGFLEDYCKYLQGIRTHKSYKNDISYLRTFFGPICSPLKLGGTCNKGKVPTKKELKLHDRLAGRHVRVGLLEDVTTGVVSQFISGRVLKDGISPKTANRLREVLHRMFAYAIKEKGYTGPDGARTNPVSAVDHRREPAPEIQFLRLADIDAQLTALEDLPTLKAMVATYIYSGLRREEAIWLTMDDVDLSRRVIYVRAKRIQGQQWQPKTKRNRAVPISRSLYEVLDNYMPQRTESWFFPSPRGRRWDPDNFSQELRQANKRHGLDWSCLDFRHTFGSQLAQKGESLFKIAELMGNSPEICRRHYAALVPEEMHDTVEFRSQGQTEHRQATVGLGHGQGQLDHPRGRAVRPQLRMIRTGGDELAS